MNLNSSEKQTKQIVYNHESKQIRYEVDLEKDLVKKFKQTELHLRVYYDNKLIDQLYIDTSKIDILDNKKSSVDGLNSIFETHDGIKLFRPFTGKDSKEFFKNPLLIGKINDKEYLKVYSTGLFTGRVSFFINDKLVFKEKSFGRSWSLKKETKRGLISKQEFIKKKGFMESKETSTVSQDNGSGWMGLVGLCFIIFVGYKFFSGSLKEYKPFFCDWKSGVLYNPNPIKDDSLEVSKPCEEGQSIYKKYIDYEFSNIKECNKFIGDYGNTNEMKIKYPSGKWIIGCDKKWDSK